MSPHLDLEIRDGIAIVTLLGEKLAPEASEPLYELAGRHPRLILDFDRVRFLSSHALGILVALRKRVDAAGGSLRLCCLAPDLLQLLQLTNLDRVFVISETRQEALDRP